MILRGQRIVTNIPPKQHTIPANVLPNDSKAFYPENYPRSAIVMMKFS